MPPMRFTTFNDNICMPVPRQGLYFKRHMSCPFLCSVSDGEMIVRFVDIGGIVDNHCINFLFVTIMQRLC